jgi:hypothetical protein
MVVAVCLAVVLAPVGVFAASHSRVSIVDAKNPRHGATVTKKGQQVVTGSVHLAGTPSLKLAGSPRVQVAPSLPGTPFSATTSTFGEPISVPSGKTLVVTDLTGYVTGDAGVGANMEINAGPHLMQMPLIDEGDFAGSQVWVANQTTNFAVTGTISVSQAQVSSGTSTNNLTVYGYLVSR